MGTAAPEAKGAEPTNRITGKEGLQMKKTVLLLTVAAVLFCTAGSAFAHHGRRGHRDGYDRRGYRYQERNRSAPERRPGNDDQRYYYRHPANCPCCH